MRASGREFFPWRLMAMGNASLSKSMAYWKFPFSSFKSAASTNKYMNSLLLFFIILFFLIYSILESILSESGIQIYGDFTVDDFGGSY